MAEAYNAKPIQFDNSNNETLMKLGDQMRQEKLYQRQLERENKKAMISAQAGVDNAVHQMGWVDDVTSYALKDVTNWAAQNANGDPEQFQIELNKKLASISGLNTAVKSQQTDSKAIADELAKANPGLNSGALQRAYLDNAIFDYTPDGRKVLKSASQINSDPNKGLQELLATHPDSFYDTKDADKDILDYHDNKALKVSEKNAMKTRDAKGNVVYNNSLVDYNARTQRIQDGEIVLNTDPKTGLINDQVFEDLNKGRVHADLVAKAHQFALHYNDPSVTDKDRAAMLGVPEGTLPKHIDTENPQQMQVLMKSILTDKMQGLGRKSSEIQQQLAPVTNNHIKIDNGNKTPEYIDAYAEAKAAFTPDDKSNADKDGSLFKSMQDMPNSFIDYAIPIANKRKTQAKSEESLTADNTVARIDGKGNMSIWYAPKKEVGKGANKHIEMGTPVFIANISKTDLNTNANKGVSSKPEQQVLKDQKKTGAAGL